MMYLAHWAGCMAARFGAPVYLVGSALCKVSPRDVDIRIVIPDRDFEARYHQTPEEWRAGRGPRWVEDIAKLGCEIAREKNLNIDFQVYPESAWRDKASMRLTLASVPNEPRLVPPLCDDPDFWALHAPEPCAPDATPA